VRTLSEDSLRWGRPGEEAWAAPGEVEEMLRHLIERDKIDKLRYLRTRREIWKATKKLRGRIHVRIEQAATKQVQLQRLTGLALVGYQAPQGVRFHRDGMPVFSIDSLRESRREGDDGMVLNQVFITLLQKLRVEGDGGMHDIRCGSTLVVDMNENKITYVITKGLDDRERINRITEYKERRLGATSLAETYFGPNIEPFAALHITA
jgi:hypothetical protein